MISIKSTFKMNIGDIQPSQLYISKKKLAKVKEKLNSKDLSTLEVIPIKKIGNETFYVDGHTRAFAAYQVGFTEIPVKWEEDELDWEMYVICIKWCKDTGIYSIADLKNYVVDHKKYKILWYKRCDNLHKELSSKKSR
ncbi:MAG: ParB/Srx family N-terminal domain-containing protein [Candidatus Odinarchaeota archaeon]